MASNTTRGRLGSARRRRGVLRAVLAAALIALATAVTTAFAIPQVLRLGDTAAGTLDTGIETLRFYAVAGTDLRLTVKLGGGLDCDVSVYDPAGAELPTSSTTDAMGDRLSIRTLVATTGVHKVVLEAMGGTSGTYRVRPTGRVPSNLQFDGEADDGEAQWFTFDAPAGARVASITVRRTDSTLSFPFAGVLHDPEGRAVRFRRQRTRRASLRALRATLPEDGTYTFRFMTKGSGEWVADVRLVDPAPSASVLQVPLGTIPVSCSGTGVRLGVSSPSGAAYFVAGDAPWIGVVLNDDTGAPLAPSDLSTCNLYLYGPQEPSKTVTAVGLLRASTDRNARPHHYIDLLTDPAVQRCGNVLLYPLSAVSTEDAGTYTATVWARLASDGLQQWFPLQDLQIKTATAETQVVERTKCAKCHLGPISGKFYLHHVDTSGNNPTGNWSIDSWPTRTCKSCHNNDGYAAFRNGKSSGDSNVDRTADPIVRRVHGVHMGEGWPEATDANGAVIPGVGFEGLTNPFNTDPVTGDFRDYTTTVMPADVRKCGNCHVDERWNTMPTRSACGACHDATWFGDPSQTPVGMKNHIENPQNDDTKCTICHSPIGGLAGVKPSHEVGPKAPWALNTVDLSLTPPLNGKYYTAADDAAGVDVTVAIRTDANDPNVVIDHTGVTDTNFSAANLFVHGPRARSVPVLTNTAIFGNSRKRASTSNATAASGSPAGWDFDGTEVFKIAINGALPMELQAPGGHVTQQEVLDWLNAAFEANDVEAVAKASGSTKVTIECLIQNYLGSRIEIWGGPVTDIMGWKPAGVTMEPYVKVGSSSYPSNDLRGIKSPNPLDWYDPDVTRTAANIRYRLRGKFADLAPGTYVVYFYCVPKDGKVPGFDNKSGLGFMTFQVGTATPEKKVATNCGDCHGDGIMHLYESHIHPARFDPDYCKSCHDYGHYETGDAFVNQGGTSTNGWSGFGAVPIARRVHGVHRGAYLERPEEIYANANPFAEVIFPQDIRNCTKCHSETDTWASKPSRVACLACHDSDAAKSHGAIMTYMTDQSDPYGPGSSESCIVCHGEGADFAVRKVHSISDPYVPPYPREE